MSNDVNSVVTPTMVETRSGFFIDLENPNPDYITIEDIAWSLSRQSRYGGHCVSRIPLSIGQHTISVSQYIMDALDPNKTSSARHKSLKRFLQLDAERTGNQNLLENLKLVMAQPSAKTRMSYAFHGLMHDFAEAYLTDVPTPVKRLSGVYESFKAHENRLDQTIYKRFGLDYSPDQQPEKWLFGSVVVRWADLYALQVEAHHLLPSRGKNWGIPLPPLAIDELEYFEWPKPSEFIYNELIWYFNELKPA